MKTLTRRNNEQKYYSHNLQSYPTELLCAYLMQMLARVRSLLAEAGSTSEVVLVDGAWSPVCIEQG